MTRPDTVSVRCMLKEAERTLINKIISTDDSPHQTASAAMASIDDMTPLLRSQINDVARS